jgi:hypothetical protein
MGAAIVLAWREQRYRVYLEHICSPCYCMDSGTLAILFTFSTWQSFSNSQALGDPIPIIIAMVVLITVVCDPPVSNQN